ncbi:MAG: 50S ribosomal protein L21 [Candidatus Omnitrophica bacterium]|nr:50S ribosomal protein L21 [Candidatus Omnitrophota bacterium]
MYAIIEVGGRQYKVAPADVIEVNRLPDAVDSSLSLDKVLLVADGSVVKIGRPYVPNAAVTAAVVAQTKGKKVVAYKYWRRKDAHKKIGHRQSLTRLRITAINA